MQESTAIMNEFSINSNKNDLFESLKKLSKVIEDSEERLKNSIAKSNVGVWEWDLHSGNLIWDETMCKMYEVKPAEVSKKYIDWASRVHPDDIDKTEMLLETCKNEIQEDFNAIFRIKHKKEYRYIIAQGFKTFDSENRVKSIIGTNIMLPKMLNKYIDLK